MGHTDCSPPLRHVDGHAGEVEPERFTIRQIAAYHAARGERAAYILMLGTCCFSAHTGCEAMNRRLRDDHAALEQAGHSVAPLLEYAELVQRPLTTARRLLRFAPSLISFDVDAPRLAAAAALGNKTLELAESGRHSGMVQHLAAHNFTVTSKVYASLA